MKITQAHLEQARDTIANVLDEIGLEAYLFEVEPREGQWGVKIECGIDEGWETFNVTALEEYLVRGKDDAIIHQLLVEEWREVLQECKCEKQATKSL